MPNFYPHKIKTPERIGIKFGTVHYVLEICSQTKLCEIHDLLLLYFSRTDLEATPSTNFHPKWLTVVVVLVVVVVVVYTWGEMPKRDEEF